MLFQTKQKQVESQLSVYCKEVLACLDLFHKTLQHYRDNPDRDALRTNVHQVHAAESRADDIRRDIEVLMYSKALFPESRGDILGLLETMDRVPNQAESSVRLILNQHVEVPKAYWSKIMHLADVCRRTVDAMIGSVEKLFTDFTNAAVAVGKIDELESEGDGIEAELIDQAFSDDLDSLHKILLRDLAQHIAQISDRAEDVGDRIRIIVAKRSV